MQFQPFAQAVAAQFVAMSYAELYTVDIAGDDLRKQAQEIRAEAGQRAMALEAKAEQLLAIENKPTLKKEPS